MTLKQALAFVKRHGVVLEAGCGPVPNLAEFIAGEKIKSSWWGHPKGREIFRVTRAIRDSKEVLVCRLVSGKITYVHRRLWPALVRLGAELGKAKLAAIREKHTASGAHRILNTAFPRWVSRKTLMASQKLSREEALAQLPSSLRFG